MGKIKFMETVIRIIMIALILSAPIHLKAKQNSGHPSKQINKDRLIFKKGTVDLDLCETTPFVFKGKLYRLEWERPTYFLKGGGCLRIMDHDKQTVVGKFGYKQRFPCAIVRRDTVYVIGTNESHGWYGDTLSVFTSSDLVHWKKQVGFADSRFGFCNTSVCKTDNAYLMSIEITKDSPGANGYFSGRFLESKDLIHWNLLNEECHLQNNGKAISPHCIRYNEGWYYIFSTVGGYPTGYVLLLTRSKDLKRWEDSPLNPVMFATSEDKLILNKALTNEQKEKISKAVDCNNSDIDFCEFKGKLIINYCWGNQKGTEFLAEAEYRGTEVQFLKTWFPTKKQ